MANFGDIAGALGSGVGDLANVEAGKYGGAIQAERVNQLVREAQARLEEAKKRSDIDTSYLGIERQREARLESSAAEQAAQGKRADLARFANDLYTRAQATRQFTDDDARAATSVAKMMFPEVPETELEAMTVRAKGVAKASEAKFREEEKRQADRDINLDRMKRATALAEIRAKTEAAMVQLDKRLAAQAELAKKKIEIELQKAGAKLPTKTSEALVGMYVITQNMRDLRAMMQAYPEKLGPGRGLVTTVGAWFNEEDAQIHSSFTHLFAQLAKNYGGARGFAKVEQPIFRDLAGGVNRTVEANEGDLRSIENWVQANREAWTLTIPEQQRVSLGPLLGASNVVPPPTGPPGPTGPTGLTEPAQTPTHRKDPLTQKWWHLDEKKVWQLDPTQPK